MDFNDAVFVAGLCFITAGVAFIFWPAALIVAGVTGVLVALAAGEA